MITIFNRRELIVTHSMKEQGEIREILVENNIKYTMTTRNRNSSSLLGGTRQITGSLGQNMEMVYEYTFFVHKKDYEEAVARLQRIL